MKYPPLVAGLLMALFAGCSSTPITSSTGNDAGPADGAAAEASAPDVGAAVDAAAESAAPQIDAEAPAPPVQCLESPQPQAGARSVVTMTVGLEYGGKPVPFGEPFALAGGGTLTIGNFRFFVSDFMLLRQDGSPVAVDIVTADGKPVPYNVHLVNAEDDAAMSFHIAAPTGEYAGMSFLFGINDACNRLNVSNTRPPLTYSSQLSWPQAFGYLFLRYEGNLMGVGEKDGPPTALAMSGFKGSIFAPRVSAEGSLRFAGAADAVRLHVTLEELFKAALLPATPEIPAPPTLPPTVDTPGGPEITAGEHLRLNLDKVQIFSVTSGH